MAGYVGWIRAAIHRWFVNTARMFGHMRRIATRIRPTGLLMRTNKCKQFWNKWWPLILGVLACMLTIFIYVYYFKDKEISATPEAWGQLGDFFGGVLNPWLAFITFVLVWRGYMNDRSEKLNQQFLDLIQVFHIARDSLRYQASQCKPTESGASGLFDYEGMLVSKIGQISGIHNRHLCWPIESAPLKGYSSYSASVLALLQKMDSLADSDTELKTHWKTIIASLLSREELFVLFWMENNYSNRVNRSVLCSAIENAEIYNCEKAYSHLLLKKVDLPEINKFCEPYSNEN